MKKIIVNLKVAIMYTLLLKLQCMLTTHYMVAGTCTICAATKNTMNLKSGYAMLLEVITLYNRYNWLQIHVSHSESKDTQL